MKLLVTDKFWGPIDEDQINKLIEECRVFPCGHCSVDHQVYHNVLGRHRHIPNEELNRILNEEGVLG